MTISGGIQSQSPSHLSSFFDWSTGVRGLMRGVIALPQGNQEPLVVKDNPQLSLRWADLYNMKVFPSALWHCWLGDRKGIWFVEKNWVLVCWWWQSDWSFARLLAPAVTTTSIIVPAVISSCHHHFHHRSSCAAGWPRLSGDIAIKQVSSSSQSFG